MKVFINSNPTKINSKDITKKVSDILLSNNHIVKISFGKEDKNNDILQNILWCDIVITIGGDGTLLTVGKLAADCKKPILGINTGRLGFLTAIDINQLDNLNHLENFNIFSLKKHYFLQARVNNSNWHYCLNDISITKDVFSNTVDLSIYTKDKLLRNFIGDGIVVATPTGSTAYSLSVGGPIVDTDLQAIIISGVAPHSLSNASLVLSKDKEVGIKLNNGDNKISFISFDGACHTKLTNNDTVYIKHSNKLVNIYTLKNMEQFEKVDKKLRLK